ncbi:MAG TPA: DinB family protein [Bryobacteraceae bacterium]|nr:DinB family protein [Bryobacteraceae bacterium]
MTVSADTLRQQLDYSAWASQRLLDEANKLSADELARDFKTADKSVLETLVHVFAADRIWLARVQGTTRASFIDPQDRDLAVLNKQWPALQQSWKQYTASLGDQDVLKVISYQDTKGNPYQQPLWQILLHLVNHGTHHRGQVSGFLRSMGHTPPVLDLMAYYRTH